MNDQPAPRFTEVNSSDLYKSLYETWRFQVNSYWQRSSYFAAFETVAIAACWKLLVDPGLSKWDELGLASLGICLTVVWFLNNARTHLYVRHWWRAILDIERELGLKERQLDFPQKIEDQKKGGLPYHVLVQLVPGIFMIAWFYLLARGIESVCTCQQRIP